jgi:hypothetical protein
VNEDTAYQEDQKDMTYIKKISPPRYPIVLTSSQGFCGISAFVNAYVFMSMWQFISAWPDLNWLTSGGCTSPTCQHASLSHRDIVFSTERAPCADEVTGFDPRHRVWILAATKSAIEP